MEISNKLFERIVIIAIIFVLLGFFGLKIKDYNNLNLQENFLTTNDAFRYARYAIELNNGAYQAIDYLADVPDYDINQYPPPLLSSIASFLSLISGYHINYFIVFIPVVFSAFFVVPLYFFLKPLDNLFALIGGIVLGLFNANYFIRTKLGYFDTDCLMLFFVFMIVFLLSKSLREDNSRMKSYGYILAAGITVIVFRWWYNHLFISIIFLTSFICGLLVSKKSLKDAFMMFSFLFVLLNPIELIYYIINSPFIKEYLYGTVFNVTYYKNPINIYADIGELQSFDLLAFIKQTTDNTLSFGLGIFFFILFFVKNYKPMMLTLPFVIIGFSSFHIGYRYLIYASIFIGIGIGYGLYLLFRIVNKRLINSNQLLFNIIGIIVVIFFTFPAQRIYSETRPLLSNQLVSNYIRISELTEKDAYLWTWWDFGNPIQYYSKRGMFLDNSHIDPLKVYVVLNSLIAQDEGLTYKSIAFITNNLKKDYYGKPELVLSKIASYDKKVSKPVYVLLYENVLTRNILKDNALEKDLANDMIKRLPGYSFICSITRDIKADCGTFFFDLSKEKITSFKDTISKDYQKIVFFNKQKNTIRTFFFNERSSNTIYLILTKNGTLRYTLAHENIEQTVLFRMLIASENNFDHFELVYEDYPYMVLYKVK